MTALYEAALVNALANHVIPRLPDVTQIPEANWAGWEPVFTELQVDRSNEQLVTETVQRCQTMLGSLLQAALMSGQQQVQQQGGELAAVAPLNAQQVAQPAAADVAAQQPSVAGAPAAVPQPGTEGQVTASQLQLTQLVGSAGEQQVLLNQPKASIIARARLPRGDRLEIWYQLAFEGYPESEAEWFPANRIRSEYPHGDELIQNFERGLDQSGQQDAQLPGAALSDVQLPDPMPLAVMPPGAEGMAGGDAAAAGVPGAAGDAASMQQFMASIGRDGEGDVAVGAKRGRDDGEAGDDPSKRQHTEGAAADPAAAAAAAAAAEAAATSAGMAAQLGAGGQLFAMAGADGQPMLQVVPLQMPNQLDHAALGQLDLSQLAGLDPQTLQALSMQGLQVGNMQQLVLHMPAGAAGGSHPMLTAATLGQHGLQLAVPHQMQMHHAHHPGREHIIAHIKDAIKLLMHSSEELQRKKRQQSRRSELNQRRALLLPDGSAAPGSLPTTAAGTPAPPPVRPTNMLAAIQALPPAEKRAMLISALRRALPVMMQTAQAIPALVSRQHQEAMAAADNEAMMQYHQAMMSAQAGAGGMGGMQLIAVPLQGGMQGLMQLSAEQLQQMGLPPGTPLTLDANGQLQLPGMAMLADPAMAAANPAMLASMGMLTAEQLQAYGIQADPSVMAGLDAAAVAAAAGMAMPGQEQLAGVALQPDAAAAALMAQDPAAMQAAADAGHLAYDPAAMAADAGMVHAAPEAAAGAVQEGQAPDGAAAAAAADLAAPADAAGGAAGAPAVDGAAAPAAPAAEGAAAAGGAAKPRTREEEAILAAISLTNLSRMPGPEDDTGAAADPAGAAPNAAGAPVDASQQLATSVVMEAAAPVPVTPAAAEMPVADGTAAAGAAAFPAAAQGPDAAAQPAVVAPQYVAADHLQHQPEGDDKQYLQLPAHLAGMQQVLDGINPELLNPQLQTQDFEAMGHMPPHDGGAM